MAFTFVTKNNTSTRTGSATTVSVGLTGIAAGDLIAAGVNYYPATTVSVSDGTTSFTEQSSAFYNNDGGTGGFARIFYLLSSVATGSVTYTATFGMSMSSVREIFAFAYRPALPPVVTDGANHNGSTTGTTVISGNITTTGTSEVVFGAFWYNAAQTNSSHQINGIAADQVQTAGADFFSALWSKTFSATFTGGASCTQSVSDHWGSSIAAFKETGAAAYPAHVYQRMMTA